MLEKIRINPFGKIKSRVFALILLMLSCSLFLSAFKSLGRSFDGMVIHKEINSGFIKNSYQLYIDQEYLSSQKKEIANEDIINIFRGNLNDYTMIGVSYFVYVQADKSMIIKKDKNSPIIYLNNEKFIDKGFVWGIISILGMIISFLIYKQTLIKLPNEDSNKTDEEIAI